METKQKLEWDEKYSVDVELIDSQHKQLIKTINDLISVMNRNPVEGGLKGIIKTLIESKKNHFETEEKYFKEFNFEGAEKHMAEHRFFTKKIEEIENRSNGDETILAFELFDFLGDWLIDHIMTVDHQYKECFKSHGLE